MTPPPRLLARHTSLIYFPGCDFACGSPQDVGWLRVKVTPVKQALVTWSSKWVNMFTAHLQSTLVSAQKRVNRATLEIF